MKIIPNEEFTKLFFIPEGTKEILRLTAFPGLLRDGPSFFCPYNISVINNLLERLKTKNFDIKIHKEILLDLDVFKNNPDYQVKFDSLYACQNIALSFLINNGGGGLLMEPGMGKTRVVYKYIEQQRFKKVIVICPKPLLFVWEDEQLDYFPDLILGLIEVPGVEEAREIIETNDIIVTNYNRAVILEDLLLSYKFDLIVLDEALIKNYNTVRSKSLTKLGMQIPNRVIMSGTLVNNSPVDIFSPIRFLQPSLVGYSATKFKEEYCSFARMKGTQNKFVTGYRKLDEIRKIVETACIVMTKAQWLDLPEKIFYPTISSSSSPQYQAYQELKSNYIVKLTNDLTVEIDSPLALCSKLIQISNGFMYYPEDDLSTEELRSLEIKEKIRKTYFFPKNAKLEKLIEMIRDPECLRNRRFILWYNMAAERELLEKRLTEEKIPYIVARGNDPKLKEVIRTFNTSRQYQILLCQACSLNYGLTVLGFSADEDGDKDKKVIPEFEPNIYIEVFFSINYSLQRFLQQQDRIHRIGQHNICLYYILMCSGIEEEIYKVLAAKQEVSNQILIDIARSLGYEQRNDNED